MPEKGYHQKPHERTSRRGRKYMAGKGQEKPAKPSRRGSRARKELQESMSLATENLASFSAPQWTKAEFVNDPAKPPVDFKSSKLSWAKPKPSVGSQPPYDVTGKKRYHGTRRDGIGKFVHISRKPFKVAISPLGRLKNWTEMTPHLRGDTVFLDEINRTPDSVQKAMLGLLGEKNPAVNMDDIERAPEDVQNTLMGTYDSKQDPSVYLNEFRRAPEDVQNTIMGKNDKNIPSVDKDENGEWRIERATEDTQRALMGEYGKKPSETFGLPPGVTAEQYFADPSVPLDELKRVPEDVQNAIMGKNDDKNKNEKEWPKDFAIDVEKGTNLSDLVYRRKFGDKEEKIENIPNWDGSPGEYKNLKKDS